MMVLLVLSFRCVSSYEPMKYYMNLDMSCITPIPTNFYKFLLCSITKYSYFNNIYTIKYDYKFLFQDAHA